MALYSFGVRKKGETEIQTSNQKFELPFLDFFAMQFNNQRELISFLGADPDVYDGIWICYKHAGKCKYLPIYFDAPELEQICAHMIDFDRIKGTSSIYEMLAVAYDRKRLLQVGQVPEISATNKIISKIASNDLIDMAARMHYINKKALEYWENGIEIFFATELMSSYIQIRKAYTFLRENGYLSGLADSKEVPVMTMQTLVQRYNERQTFIEYTNELSVVANILNSLEITPYEEFLISQALNGDEASFEILMVSDIERVIYLKPILDYIASERGKVKKLGTID